MTRNVSLNVRFELWTQQRDQRAHWVEWLASHTNLGVPFCRNLLLDQVTDESVTHEQLVALVHALGLPDHGSSLRFDEPLTKANVLRENLNFLFDSLGHGGKTRAAESLGVAQTTISRWLAGATAPRGPALRRIIDHFRLPASTDLRKDPLFLSLDPVSAVTKRHWVRDRLDNLSEQELQDLYPALRRMLEEDR